MPVLGERALTLGELRAAAEGASLRVSPAAAHRIAAASAVVQRHAAGDTAVYGLNTGIGKLASTRIPAEGLERLQRNIILSHAVGTGPLLDAGTVRLILALKAASFCQGYSGVRPAVVDMLLALLDEGILPCVPAQGSVGASGDLAPLAHVASVMIGVGEAQVRGVRRSAREALAAAGLAPIVLGPKEGIALINGTQVSTALALRGLWAIEDVFAAAMAAGALSVDAAAGSDAPFDDRIQVARGHAAQREVAGRYRELLAGSAIRESHRLGDARVQDPYSLRCQPQVMGACLQQMRDAAQVLLTEANGTSDNPLVFVDTGELLSGGNFHAEPVGLAADGLALAVAEIGSMSERRTALLVDAGLSRLPAFLVRDSGLNSGFMMAQVTAAALASENKALAHPSSVDSIPTSANQEDFVSMATHAARRLSEMAGNAATIVAIELLAAAQGVQLRAPLVTSPALAGVLERVRRDVAFYDEDRYFAPDIEAIRQQIVAGHYRQFGAGLLPTR